MILSEKLQLLGFVPGSDGILVWGGPYPIRVAYDAADHGRSAVDYGPRIKVWHRSCLGLRKPENLVTLECVIRLLNKGYDPACIELKRSWPSGHGTSGRIDIVLLDTRKKAYALIECKSWGEEYARERNNILDDGGQLFTYFSLETAARTLVLYTSLVEEGGVRMQAECIETATLSGSNSEERFRSWNKSFIAGIFDHGAAPYRSQKRNRLKKDLTELDKENGRGLFNSFAEILRRHTISDKSNAFNKIFNLFVCKIYDEDTHQPDEELDFQWKTSDSFQSLIDRLGHLYIHGLEDYLQIKVERKYFSILSELSFVDIFDEESYAHNFTIVKEMVELLQGFQLKYTSRHQYLGDFFENLLTTGIKQEAGQFFTPVPLARFFLRSLPIDGFIQERIASKSPRILPLLIDYACGSGHFLTEAIEEIAGEIQKIDAASLVGRNQQKFLSMKDNFLWARDHVYGIEKDYRLAKTTKIAMFLNGDGDAVIVNGDGLDDFHESTAYQGVLKTSHPARQLNVFDILISNPPFSIPGFRQYLKNGENNFDLYHFLSNKSTEIECLFLERMAQLLAPGGFGAIILPLSILNSDNRIYVEARRSLLTLFELKGLVELRDKTFIATNTTTVGIFLKKRPAVAIHETMALLHRHFVGHTTQPRVVTAMERLSTYCDWLTFEAHLITNFFAAQALDEHQILNGTYDLHAMPHSLGYLLIALLNETSQTVIAYSGEKKEQEAFLGYRFSKSRGSEGCEPLLDEQGLIATKLYDAADLDNPEKVNAHIRAAFNNRVLPIPATLEKNLKHEDSLSLLKKPAFIISNPSAYFESDQYVIESSSPLGDFIDTFAQQTYQFSELLRSGQVEYHSGLVYSKRAEVPFPTAKKVLTASNIDLHTGRLVFDKLIYLKADHELPQHIVPQANDIIMSTSSGSLKHLGKVAFCQRDMQDAVIGGFLSIIRCRDARLAKALYYRLLSYQFRRYAASLRDQNINNLNLSELNQFLLSLPTDLDAFCAMAAEKEEQLRVAEEALRGLKN